MAWIADTFEKLSPIHRAFMVVITTFLAGSMVGAVFMGLSEIPSIVQSNASQIEILKSNDRNLFLADSLINQRINRLTCLMEAQFEGTNPTRCN